MGEAICLPRGSTSPSLRAQLHYRRGYKYQTARVFLCSLPWYDGPDVDTEFTHLRAGRITILSGYAWDGPSGPTFDTASFMRGSLVHDALYQLIREGLIPRTLRGAADLQLWRMCRDDGMGRWRAAYVLWAVKRFAKFATYGDGGHPLLVAP